MVRSTLDPAPYVPGFFYLRELPYLLDVLTELDPPATTVLVDGHVWLANGDPGLGAKLYERLGGGVPVVGIAKRHFRGENRAIPVLRPGSARPLWVSAAGMDEQTAARHVASMHGQHRIPTLVKLADRLSRTR
jgi:deoxyribonuclease V